MGRHPFLIEFVFPPSDILSISLCKQKTPYKVKLPTAFHVLLVLFCLVFCLVFFVNLFFVSRLFSFLYLEFVKVDQEIPKQLMKNGSTCFFFQKFDNSNNFPQTHFRCQIDSRLRLGSKDSFVQFALLWSSTADIIVLQEINIARVHNLSYLINYNFSCLKKAANLATIWRHLQVASVANLAVRWSRHGNYD